MQHWALSPAAPAPDNFKAQRMNMKQNAALVICTRAADGIKLN